MTWIYTDTYICIHALVYKGTKHLGYRTKYVHTRIYTNEHAVEIPTYIYMFKNTCIHATKHVYIQTHSKLTQRLLYASKESRALATAAKALFAHTASGLYICMHIYVGILCMPAANHVPCPVVTKNNTCMYVCTSA